MALSSPKRKRGEEFPIPPLQTIDFPSHILSASADSDIDESPSPRTMVTGRFQKLQIHNQGRFADHSVVDTRPSPKRVMVDKDSVQAQTGDHSTERFPYNPDSSEQSMVRPPSATTFQFDGFEANSRDIDARPKSPPLIGDHSDQFWHEDEITGHEPDDPNDDGYGINGIGFKPTAAIAWARSQRRRQQLADYRSREAREARQRRSERRRIVYSDNRFDLSSERSVERRTRVHFEDG